MHRYFPPDYLRGRMGVRKGGGLLEGEGQKPRDHGISSFFSGKIYHARCCTFKLETCTLVYSYVMRMV